MKTKSTLSPRRPPRARRALAILSIAMLLTGALTVGVTAQNMKARPDKNAARLSQDQRILHVLNRLGFGARPGDVAKVKAMGVDKYILSQLEPQKIDDAVAEAKLQNLDSLRMSNAELYDKYPQPGQILRQLERRGAVPADLAAANNAPKASKPADAMPADMPAEMGQDNAKGKSAQTKAPAAVNNAANLQNSPEYRKAVRDYFMENNLRPPQFLTGELQMSRILRAVYSERQLQEVMVDFWTNHFNVFSGKGADRWLLTAYDRDTIRPHTMGKFYDLLLADAQSPAMLFYLDNVQSVSPNSQQNRPGQRPGAAARNPLRQLLRPNARNFPQVGNNPQPQQQQRPVQQQQQAAPRRGINENYARELMELHTLGVDGGYTQKDVQEVARCFTGWTIIAPRGVQNPFAADQLRERAGSFVFNPRVHDDGEKIVLGHKIPAGGGEKDGLMVLDILAHHPSTAHFIATKLVRHFVSDDPPPALVDRVAETFLKSDGDTREVLKAIFFSPEFNSADAYRAKIKRPFELVISAVRTLGGDTNGGPQIHQWIARMGQPLYGFQTPNGYSDVAENWVNTGALLERMNFALALVTNRIPGTRVDLGRFLDDVGGNGQTVNKDKLLDRFITLIVGGELSPKTRETLSKQLSDQMTLPAMPRVAAAPVGPPENPFESGFKRGALGLPGGPNQQQRQPQQLASISAGAVDNPVIKIAGLILGSPEFQRQ